mgnify:CR=1 FL=1|jgi:hypothetical protein
MIIIVNSALEERIEQFANHNSKWDDKGVTFLDTSKRDIIIVFMQKTPYNSKYEYN